MIDQKKSPLEFTVEELDKELIARGAKAPVEKQFAFEDSEGTPERNAMMTGVKELYETPPPPNEALAFISTWDLAKILIYKTGSAMDFTRGAWSDDLMDCYEISDEQINQNAGSTAAVILKNNLIDDENGFSTLRVKNYGEAFNLCDLEPFHYQPIAGGLIFTGILVKDDIIATIGSNVNESNVTELRFVFGFKMLDSVTPVTRFSNDDIYRGEKILHRVHNPGVKGADWALVKLDRSVAGQTAAELSGNGISSDQQVYVLGHPLGLPMKYASGLSICDTHETYFETDINLYSGNPGSPVFDLHTHKFLGIVVKGDYRDFRWTGNCWMSVNYPDGRKAVCIRASELLHILDKL